jgi:hypothetical protein
VAVQFTIIAKRGCELLSKIVTFEVLYHSILGVDYVLVSIVRFVASNCFANSSSCCYKAAEAGCCS